MKPAGVGSFSAAGRSAVVSPFATRADAEAPGGPRRRWFIEMQWRGSGGRFRHLAVRPPGLRRVTRTVGIVALLALAVGVGGTFSGAARSATSPSGVGAILNEHAGLKARHAALRERAFDLAEQLYARVEQGRRMVFRAGTASESRTDQCPRPPARDAEDEAIFAWLAEQGMWLEAIGGELTAGRVETGVTQALTPAPVSTQVVPTRDAGVTRVADNGLARGLAAAQATR